MRKEAEAEDRRERRVAKGLPVSDKPVTAITSVKEAKGAAESVERRIELVKEIAKQYKVKDAETLRKILRELVKKMFGERSLER